MSRTLTDLSQSLRQRAAKVETFGNELSKAGTLAMLEEMLAVTPVDESTAISNWQVNLGNPAADVLPAVARGNKGSTRGTSADKTLADGREELQYKKPGQPVFLSNLTPYIKDLDDGSSMQFSGGFVPRALIVFRLAVQEARKRLLG